MTEERSTDYAAQWFRIMKGGTEREVTIGPDGIARAHGLCEGAGQEVERQKRESAAAPFVDSSQKAFLEAVRHHSRGVMRRRARQVLESLVESTPGGEAVFTDLGSGFGWHWVGLAREFPSVKFVLVDFAINNLTICRKLMPVQEYPNVLCLHSDLAEVPLADHVADFCWSVQVLQHLPPEKRKEGFREVTRLLKPAGRFYFAWLRSVPLVRAVYAAFRKPYHEVGPMGSGIYLQRFDETIAAEIKATFGPSHMTYSETLFHPDLFWAPTSPLVGALDMRLGSTGLAKLLARQAEIWGGAAHFSRGS